MQHRWVSYLPSHGVFEWGIQLTHLTSTRSVDIIYIMQSNLFHRPRPKDDHCLNTTDFGWWHFLVINTSINKCVKYDQFYSMTATSTNLDRKLPRQNWRQTRPFRVDCFSKMVNIVFGHVRKFLYRKHFYDTTCLWRLIYIGSQGGCLRQAWLYLILQIFLIFKLCVFWNYDSAILWSASREGVPLRQKKLTRLIAMFVD